MSDIRFGELTRPPRPSCGYCRQPVGWASRSVCPRCQVIYHHECWKANEYRCGVFGCVPAVQRPPLSRVGPSWIVVLSLLGLVSLAVLSIPSAPPSRTGSFGLRTYAAAQREYRVLTGAGFWRKDIAGLFSVRGKDGQLYRLISPLGAAADDRPSVVEIVPRKPSHGYWFRAIRHEGETEPDPNRFAACAFPSNYPSSGRNTFIISEKGIVYKIDLGHGRGVDLYPADPEKDGWRTLD